MRAGRIVLTVVTLASLVACGPGATTGGPPVTTAPTSASSPTGDGEQPAAGPQPERRDIDVVGDGSDRHKMDLFLPQGKGEGPFPLLIWVHGGGWRMGDKADLDSGDLQTGQMKKLLLDHGYAIASVNYRLLPDGTKFPEPMQDVAAAVRYLRSHAAELGVDPQRFAIGGESAGAHLAAMVGLTPKDAELQGTLGQTDADASVRAIVGFYGLYDLTRRTEDQKEKCGSERPGAESSHGRLVGADPDSPEGEPAAKRASPVAHVDPSSPPMLLFAGTRDCTAPHPQSDRMHAALKGAGVATELTTIDAEHAKPEYYTDGKLQEQLVRFLDAHVKG